MTNAFSQAAAVLHADPNLSVAATYQPVAATSFEMRVIRTAPVERFDETGCASLASRDEVSALATAFTAEPRRGDELLIEGRHLLVEEARLDREGVTFLLILSRD